MNDQFILFVSIFNYDPLAAAFKIAPVANLSAGFCIKWCPVQERFRNTPALSLSLCGI